VLVIKQYFIAFIFILFGLKSHSQVDSLKRVAMEISTDTARVTKLNEIAKQYFRINMSVATELLNSALLLSEKIKDNKSKALTLKNIGTSNYYLGKYSETEKFWKTSLNLYVEVNYPKGIADLNNNIGLYYHRIAKLDSSLKYHQKALQARKKMNDTLNIANSISNIGGIYRTKGEYQKALENYHKALKIYENRNSKKQISDSYNSIGLVYMNLANYERALEFFNKSLIIRKEINDQRGTSSALNNIAGCYEFKKDYKNAEVFYLKYLEISKKIGNKRGIAGVLSNLGNIYKNKGDLPKSNDYYNRAAELFRLMNDIEGLAITFNNLGLQNLGLKKFDLAMSKFDSAFYFAEQFGSVDLQFIAIEGISSVYEKKKNFQKSLVYKKQSTVLKDSLYNIKSVEKIAQMQELYEAENKAKEIKILKSEAIIEQQKNENNLLFRNWAIAGVILSIFIMILIYNRFILNKKLFIQKKRILENEKEEYRLIGEIKSNEVDSKNRELSSFATNMLEKSELLNKIKLKLDQIKLGEIENANLALNNLNKLIENNNSLDTQWDDFKLHFESVHPVFFQNLTKKFPEITSNDHKMCAYIRMNLSQKEIAALLNINPQSVKMARNRLKKKLQLGTNDDLNKFIKSI